MGSPRMCQEASTNKAARICPLQVSQNKMICVLFLHKYGSLCLSVELVMRMVLVGLAAMEMTLP